MVLLLVGLALALFGAVQIGRTLTPGQRIVLGLVFILGILCLACWLVSGVFGRASGG